MISKNTFVLGPQIIRDFSEIRNGLCCCCCFLCVDHACLFEHITFNRVYAIDFAHETTLVQHAFWAHISPCRYSVSFFCVARTRFKQDKIKIYCSVSSLHFTSILDSFFSSLSFDKNLIVTFADIRMQCLFLCWNRRWICCVSDRNLYIDLRSVNRFVYPNLRSILFVSLTFSPEIQTIILKHSLLFERLLFRTALSFSYDHWVNIY